MVIKHATRSLKHTSLRSFDDKIDDSLTQYLKNAISECISYSLHHQQLNALVKENRRLRWNRENKHLFKPEDRMYILQYQFYLLCGLFSVKRYYRLWRISFFNEFVKMFLISSYQNGDTS